MKICSRCKETKPYSEFHKRSRSSDGYAAQCGTCKNGMDKSYYKNNTQKFQDRNKKVREENLQKIFEYLESHPCVDCGNDDVLVLEFDHTEKRESLCVTSMIVFSWKRIQSEIEKCEVRCSNCHVKITHKRANSSRWQYVNPR